MDRFYSLAKKERKKIIKGIKKALQKREEVVFAYLYSSFLEDPLFRDIDVGVYLTKPAYTKAKESFDYQFELAAIIEEEVGPRFLVDVRLLNEASFNFLNNIFSRGQILLCQDEEFLTNLIEKTSHRYLRYRSYAEQYLRERVELG